jgi:hypothetical protein
MPCHAKGFLPRTKLPHLAESFCQKSGMHIFTPGSHIETQDQMKRFTVLADAGSDAYTGLSPKRSRARVLTVGIFTRGLRHLP